ncbi:unnamed protein product [[Candida] boidinii]|nr:unnamed protein product [[Candida] boidinii]
MYQIQQRDLQIAYGLDKFGINESVGNWRELLTAAFAIWRNDVGHSCCSSKTAVENLPEYLTFFSAAANNNNSMDDDNVVMSNSSPSNGDMMGNIGDRMNMSNQRNGGGGIGITGNRNNHGGNGGNGGSGVGVRNNNNNRSNSMAATSQFSQSDTRSTMEDEC